MLEKELLYALFFETEDRVQGCVVKFVMVSNLPGMIPQVQIVCNSKECLLCEEPGCRGPPYIGMEDRDMDFVGSI